MDLVNLVYCCLNLHYIIADYSYYIIIIQSIPATWSIFSLYNEYSVCTRPVSCFRVRPLNSVVGAVSVVTVSSHL